MHFYIYIYVVYIDFQASFFKFAFCCFVEGEEIFNFSPNVLSCHVHYRLKGCAWFVDCILLTHDTD